jgi:MFS family permease
MEDQPVSDPDRGADRPATFREVLANGEFRAIFFSGTLSTVGDSMARAAVTALVYKSTGSVFASGATFAISYLPWIGFGSVLAALAERYPYRRTMIVCDLARMVTIGLVAIPHVPVPVLWGLLFLTALFDPPFRAARSALNARVLSGDRYVLGLSMMETAVQLSIILGYFLGGTVAAYSPRSAVLFDAVTFGLSAGIVALWVRPHEPALRPERRTHLLRETAEGFGVVFGRPVLRSIAVVVFAGLLFAVVPEGLGAAWAGWLTHGKGHAGWIQGLIMCSMPIGFILGSILISRFVPPQIRHRWRWCSPWSTRTCGGWRRSRRSAASPSRPCCRPPTACSCRRCPTSTGPARSASCRAASNSSRAELCSPPARWPAGSRCPSWSGCGAPAASS